MKLALLETGFPPAAVRERFEGYPAMFRRLLGEDAYAYTAEVMTQNMMFRDAQEGIGAFIEKRDPKWQDK